MNETEYKVQKALGLIYKWEVYVRFQKDPFYTIYEVDAPTQNIALALGHEIILKQGCKIRKRKNGTFDLFTINVSIDGPVPGNAIRAKKPY